jgi:hypothetical protein
VFSHTAEFGKKYLVVMAFKQWKTTYVGNIIAREERKTQSGKLHHPTDTFSSTYVLAIISISLFVIVL